MIAKSKKSMRTKPKRSAKRDSVFRKGTIKAQTGDSNLASPADWFVDWARGGGPASSGEVVNETTALGITAYLACIKNISEDVAKLPLGIYQRQEPRGRKQLRDHPLHVLLNNEANPEASAMSVREVLTSHALGWGGGFAEIQRRGGEPIALWPLDPTGVEVRRDTWGEKLLFYSVHGVPMVPRDILHIHGLGHSAYAGWILALLAKDPIGNALAAQKFSGSFFGNGTSTTGTIEVPDAMSETAFKHLRESFFERHTGTENQWRPVILEQGAKYSPTSTEPQKSQMIEVFQHGVEDICRLFRMPPHKIQHLLRATFSNIEMQALEYVTDCLLGWLVRWEQEIWRKLLFPQERKRVYAKHNLDMLLRGDTAARTAYYRELFNIAALSDNDIREKEDLNPIPGGDTYFLNAALVPLEMAAKGEHLAAKQAPAPAKQATPNEMPPSEGSPDDNEPPASSLVDHRFEIAARIAVAHTAAIREAIAAVLRIEHDKVTRAAKKPEFESWKARFYRENHPRDVRSKLKPAFDALYASLDSVLEAAPWN